MILRGVELQIDWLIRGEASKMDGTVAIVDSYTVYWWCFFGRLAHEKMDINKGRKSNSFVWVLIDLGFSRDINAHLCRGMQTPETFSLYVILKFHLRSPCFRKHGYGKSRRRRESGYVYPRLTGRMRQIVHGSNQVRENQFLISSLFYLHSLHFHTLIPHPSINLSHSKRDFAINSLYTTPFPASSSTQLHPSSH